VAIDRRAPAVVLGAGYAGLSVWHQAHRRARGRWPVLLVDRHPLHVVRTELYHVGRLAEARGGTRSRLALPLPDLLEGAPEALRTGEVSAIDLDARTVRLADGGSIDFGELAICLGSVPHYYGVPGAEEHTLSVYRLSHAERLAERLREIERARAGTARPPRVVVVGGGSTGTEVAAEIATTRWDRIVGRDCPPPEVLLVVGRLPFLDGLPAGLVRHARELLLRAGVRLHEGRNVTRVAPGTLTVETGETLPFDVAVWSAGVRAPDLVRSLPVPHGRSGRLLVEPTLELPGRPGVFAVGDVAELIDPTTHAAAPATAQAALAEAPVAGANLVARRTGRPLRTFRYRERGVIVELGVGKASASLGGLSVWGRPAALLKSLVEEGHRFGARAGGRPPGL
jgi:NADH dehydrogenase